MLIIQTILSPALNPSRILSLLPAPRFCAVKLEIPFARVVNDVMTRLFNLTAAEYPAIVPAPNSLITLWIMILPIEIKLCCKILGIAIFQSFTSMINEKTGHLCRTFIFDNLKNTTITARTALMP